MALAWDRETLAWFGDQETFTCNGPQEMDLV